MVNVFFYDRFGSSFLGKVVKPVSTFLSLLHTQKH